MWSPMGPRVQWDLSNEVTYGTSCTVQNLSDVVTYGTSCTVQNLSDGVAYGTSFSWPD